MLFRWALILLLVLVLFRAIGRLLAGVLQGAGYTRNGADAQGGKAVKLVRDPVCGTWVVPSRAVTLDAGSAREYFCSERCRDRYLHERRRG